MVRDTNGMNRIMVTSNLVLSCDMHLHFCEVNEGEAVCRYLKGIDIPILKLLLSLSIYLLFCVCVLDLCLYIAEISIIKPTRS